MISKLRSFLIENAVVILFVVLIAIAIPVSGLPGTFLMQEILTRLGRNTFLVIALLLPIMAGMGLNFGMVLGAMAGQLGLIFISDWGIVGIPGTAHAGQQLRCTGAGSPIRKARLRQPGQKLLHGQPGQPHAQQMAGGNGPQREGAKAQQKIAGGARRALAAGAFQHALPAGKYPCPKALAGKGKRLFALQLLHCGAGAAGG